MPNIAYGALVKAKPPYVGSFSRFLTSVPILSQLHPSSRYKGSSLFLPSLFFTLIVQEMYKLQVNVKAPVKMWSSKPPAGTTKDFRW